MFLGDVVGRNHGGFGCGGENGPLAVSDRRMRKGRGLNPSEGGCWEDCLGLSRV